MDFQIDFKKGDRVIEAIRVYADDSREREEGLQALLEIEPELRSIEQKLSSTPGTRALNRGEK